MNQPVEKNIIVNLNAQGVKMAHVYQKPLLDGTSVKGRYRSENDKWIEVMFPSDDCTWCILREYITGVEQAEVGADARKWYRAEQIKYGRIRK